MSQGATILPTTGTISGLTEQNDINAAIAALLSNNSGGSAPSSPTAGMWWWNTSTGWIQEYDGANWNNVLYIDATNHLTDVQLGGGVQASIASAATTDLWSSPGSAIKITGSATITALANSSAVPGTLKVVTFAGTLTLTQNATSLILPGAGNVTTAAGDYMLVMALTANNVVVVQYTRANGQPLITPSGMASLTLADQTLSGGANVTSYNLGTQSSGTLTVDCGKGPLQYLTNGGAFTLAAPSNDGSCIVLVTNNSSAGTITFSGFTVGVNVGAALTTTNTNKFSISVWRLNGVSGYSTFAHQ